MAYKKTEKPEAVAINETEETSETVEIAETQEAPSIIYRAKAKIPMDALVMVKNLTGGKLVYVSKRMNGYSISWDSFGEEVPVEMSELYAMKNTDRRFFTENWIEVDINVLRDLQMDRFYKNSITIDEINTMFDMDTDELIKKVKAASKTIQNSIGLRAIEMIKDRQLTDINVISALEEALNCELYER